MNKQCAIQLSKADIFQRENLILSNVNLTIDQGDFVYMVGKVGSGKSSLIKTLNAELPLYNGTGMVAGFALEKVKSHEIPFLRRKLGVVFQDFKLLTDRSVYQNLLFVLKATGWSDAKAIDQRIDEQLIEVGMVHLKNKMPHQLSGGEQQRIVIARALLNNPEIILADEPTGNLDPDTSVEILSLFKKIHAGNKTILMATHDKLIIDRFPATTYVCANSSIQKMDQSDELIDFKSILN